MALAQSAPSYNDAVSEFLAALADRGILPPGNLIADGKLHRCDAEGRRGKGDATYQLHLDGRPAGWFQNHRDGLGPQNWKAGGDYRPADRTEVDRKRRQAEAQKRADEATGRQRAQRIWRESDNASATHPYLIRKRVQPGPLREYRGSLVVPALDDAGALSSIQFISASGGKWFLKLAPTRGCCCPVGALGGHRTICIAEGYATAATIHQATGLPVAVAFSAHNLVPVAQRLRKRRPEHRIILCADDNHATEGNPGITQAERAAETVGGLVVRPAWPEAPGPKQTDFNDLFLAYGLDAVHSLIAGAS